LEFPEYQVEDPLVNAAAAAGRGTAVKASLVYIVDDRRDPAERRIGAAQA
jgi:hypothetical protein